MIVVSDTSPIYYLVEIGAADILPQLYGDVVIPPAVLDELRHPRAPTHTWAENPPEWLQVIAPREVDNSLNLDRGEREAIALAIELHADRVLMDEKLGRQAAKVRGLRVAGTLGVLLDAATADVLDFEQTIDRLRRTTFYMSDGLIATLQAELGRRKR